MFPVNVVTVAGRHYRVLAFHFWPNRSALMLRRIVAWCGCTKCTWSRAIIRRDRTSALMRYFFIDRKKQLKFLSDEYNNEKQNKLDGFTLRGSLTETDHFELYSSSLPQAGSVLSTNIHSSPRPKRERFYLNIYNHSLMTQSAFHSDESVSYNWADLATLKTI